MKKLLTFAFIIFALPVLAQSLKPGFDKQECLEMLVLSAHHADSSFYAKLPKPKFFERKYHSQEMGLQFCWDLWTNEKHQAVIDVRGSTRDQASWMANFFSAMVPAKGELKLSKTETF